MNRAARSLVGKHDFRSFQTSGAERASSVRTVFDLRVERGRAGGCEFDILPKPSRAGQLNAAHAAGQGRAGESDSITVDVEADGFLYNMVRAMVGTLVEVGRGARAKPGRPKSSMPPTAPPPAPPHRRRGYSWFEWITIEDPS